VFLCMLPRVAGSPLRAPHTRVDSWCAIDESCAVTNLVVVCFRLVKNSDTGQPKGFGFCEFRVRAYAKVVVSTMMTSYTASCNKTTLAQLWQFNCVVSSAVCPFLCSFLSFLVLIPAFETCASDRMRKPRKVRSATSTIQNFTGICMYTCIDICFYIHANILQSTTASSRNAV